MSHFFIFTLSIATSTNVNIFIKAKVTNLLPAKDDPPLKLCAPKPAFANSGSRSAFGFQAATIPETDAAADMMDDCDDIYATEDDGRKSGKIHLPPFNTLTLFARAAWERYNH